MHEVAPSGKTNQVLIGFRLALQPNFDDKVYSSEIIGSIDNWDIFPEKGLVHMVMALKNKACGLDIAIQ